MFRSLFVIAIVTTSVAIPRAARGQEDAQSGMIVINGARIAVEMIFD